MLSVIHQRLEARRDEIEAAVVARAVAIADPREVSYPRYGEGLRGAISVAVGYGLEAIGHGEGFSTPPPAELTAQARLAARSGVSLEVVLHRYFAGYLLLERYVIEEAERADGTCDEVKRLLGSVAGLLERATSEVSAEYGHEAHRLATSPEQRRIDRVRRLIDGELSELPGYDYDLDANHLGLIVVGSDGGKAVRDLAKRLDMRLLLLTPEPDTAWAWLGSRHPIDREPLEYALRRWPADLNLALGEPGAGLPGWRRTHRQASAVLPVALRRPQPVTHCAEAAILAALAQDELLTSSLLQRYLAPLDQEGDRGPVLRETLRAYFDAGRNVACTASALQVTRQTVGNRLKNVEERLGIPLTRWATDIEIALRLERMVVTNRQICPDPSIHIANPPLVS